MSITSYISKIIAQLVNLKSDFRGVTAVLIALLAIPIFGAIGLSIDLGRAYVLKSKLSTALDSAGLAAGRVVFQDDAIVRADAQKFFDANFTANYMGASVSALQVSWDANRENIELNVNADLNTTFLSVLGYNEITVGARTVVNRVNRGLELIMVLDNTGSMARDSDSNSYGGSLANQRMGSLRDAANDLVDILYGSKEVQKNLWVGIVPYVTQVNVGYDNIHFLDTDERDNIISGSSSEFYKDSDYHIPFNRNVDGSGGNDTNYGWKGCVEMRDHLDGGTIDTTDNPPNNDFLPYIYFDGHRNLNNSYRDRDNDWNDSNPGTVRHIAAADVTQWNSFNNSVGRGPNAGCPSPILPLTAEKSTVKAAIAAMRPWYSGGTMGNVGMVWGWRAISPRWRGLWYGSDPELPKDYDEPLIDKAVIMMTDGENLVFSHGSKSTFDYNSYSRHQKNAWGRHASSAGSTDAYTDPDGRLRYTSSSYYRSRIDAKFTSVCNAMKAAGIIVYTIKFKSGNDNLYRNCATSPAHFFNSPTKEALRDAFRTIGQELSNLRIAE
ncbi:TadE/TadG family type IV pilus assembly protein [Sneathiella glossodoripedis]|uniref:TadE/TadG family type IV pilus assembly protein n=1 Tax=Sneathiella glossodoripedis TaxID=418853 RepID=UPI000470056E|nr:TadE/TadG family type IV pilus assembly protein [Sneathiella glossodoripedis]